MKTSTIPLSLGVFLVLGVMCCHASDDKVQQLFENRYKAWKAWITEHPRAGTYTANEEFYAIVKLGAPAIPLIVKKVEENPGDFHLASAISLISKRRFARSEWPQGKLGDSKTAAEMYVKWWKEGRFKTGERFRKLHSKWKTLKSADKDKKVLKSAGKKKDKKAEEVYERIVDLGLSALPYLINNVEQNPELVRAISKLTDGEVSPKATPAECKQWWQKNKQKYELLLESGSTQNIDKK